MRLTNNTRDTLDFLKKGGKVKDGVPETVSLAAGETDDLEVDPKDPQVVGRIFAGAVSATPAVTERVEASVSSTTESTRKSR
jgi:hypothetical protein